MDRRIRLIIELLESNTSTLHDFDGIARQVNLSPSRLRHLFKEETGQSPRQYLKYLRLDRAAVLLRTTFLTVKEVANEVGIANASHFARDFKKHYGVAPLTYRNRG
jgi:AraC family transcriptional regulator, arabinose operon regulatory protein